MNKMITKAKEHRVIPGEVWACLLYGIIGSLFLVWADKATRDQHALILAGGIFLGAGAYALGVCVDILYKSIKGVKE